MLGAKPPSSKQWETSQSTFLMWTLFSEASLVPHDIGGVQVHMDNASIVNECDTSPQLWREGRIQLRVPSALRGSSPESQKLGRDIPAQSSSPLNLESLQTWDTQRHAAHRNYRDGSSTVSCDSTRFEYRDCDWQIKRPNPRSDTDFVIRFTKYFSREREHHLGNCRPPYSRSHLTSTAAYSRVRTSGMNPGARWWHRNRCWPPCSIPRRQRSHRLAHLVPADQYKS